MEDMPMEHVMGDMLLPTDNVLIINGVRKGSIGLWFTPDLIFKPLLYRPTSLRGQRFSSLAKKDPKNVLLEQHRTASVMVAGSNITSANNLTELLFSTELRVEKFYPPYLDLIDINTMASTIGRRPTSCSQ